ncbi:hypothetical protein SAMN06272735_9015 [Streptomyces sp. TLI_55]|uniref:hypothetical protein n=1 Tax=Streptomyces sp. TLI_55 TaxID=1938861 RepID=UPI000BC38C26|nr:hypothetical protein [Streptomyces sp. TLI_55]SNX88557.1 hypothetical protein SAMN06272735_9015 [Streptomyces sp. TLI_55]
MPRVRQCHIPANITEGDVGTGLRRDSSVSLEPAGEIFDSREARIAGLEAENTNSRIGSPDLSTCF